MDTLLSTLLVIIILAALVWGGGWLLLRRGAGDAGSKRHVQAVAPALWVEVSPVNSLLLGPPVSR
jgi:hypothetical protein